MAEHVDARDSATKHANFKPPNNPAIDTQVNGYALHSLIIAPNEKSAWNYLELSMDGPHYLCRPRRVQDMRPLDLGRRAP